jgi:hypothetical protein
MARTLAAVEAELALVSHQAGRLPKHHPDKQALHQRIDDLLAEREQLRPLRPSDVLAGRS